jgi:hypothetical protein
VSGLAADCGARCNPGKAYKDNACPHPGAGRMAGLLLRYVPGRAHAKVHDGGTSTRRSLRQNNSLHRASYVHRQAFFGAGCIGKCWRHWKPAVGGFRREPVSLKMVLKILVWMFVAILIFGIGAYYWVVANQDPNDQGVSANECISEISDLGRLVNAYAKQHNGKFPKTLHEIESLRDPRSVYPVEHYSYTVSPTGFSIDCTTGHGYDLHPEFDSQDGLVLKHQPLTH